MIITNNKQKHQNLIIKHKIRARVPKMENSRAKLTDLENKNSTEIVIAKQSEVPSGDFE